MGAADAPKESQRVELRLFRPQRSAEEFVDLIRLLEARLNFLNRLEIPLAYVEPKNIRNNQDGVNRYYQYITETGLDFETYRKYLPTKWIELQPAPKASRLPDWDRCKRFFDRMLIRYLPAV